MTEVVVDRLRLARVNYLSGRIDVYAYLVRTGRQWILVDTGVGEGNPYVDRHFEPERFPLSEALDRHGLAPAEVTAVVNSHLHFDHCGNNRLFPRATVYVQADELDAARAPRYTVREWFKHPEARLTPVDGDRVIAPGVSLIATPGHTPGHQSVLVDTAAGERILVAAQAAWTAAEYLSGGDPDAQAHDGLGDVYLRSLRRLKVLGASRVLFSHDSAEADDSRPEARR